MRSPTFVRQGGTLLRTIIDHVSDDPVFFAMQVSRRLPARLSRIAGVALSFAPGPVAKTAGAWLRGDVEDARTYVRSRARTNLGDRVLGEIALSLQDQQTVRRVVGTSGGSPAGRRLAARLEWQDGHMSRAVEVAPQGGLRRRLDAELRVFSKGWTPTVNAPGAASPPRRLGTVDVLFGLTNSLPHTQSGYALRTHAVLGALRDAGVRAIAANRTGYPTSVGRLLSRDRSQCNGVDYLYDIPPRLGRTLDRRIAQQATFLMRTAVATRAQTIHTTTHFTNGLAARAAAQALDLPWVYEVRGSLEDTWASARGDESAARSSEKFAQFRAREIEVAASADRVITLGTTMAKELVSRGVDPTKILVAPNSVGEDVLNADWGESPARVRQMLGLPTGGTWVGTAASIVHYEGLDYLVDAVVAARKAGVDLRLLVVGDGTELPALRRHAQSLGVNAVFTGRLAAKEAQEHVRALDIFAVPRRDVDVCRKITPLKPAEAGGLGRAVVLSDLPALTEALPKNARHTAEAGSTDSWTRALVDLASDQDEMARIGSSAREYVRENRTWASIGQRYRQMYAEVGVAMTGGTR